MTVLVTVVLQSMNFNLGLNSHCLTKLQQQNRQFILCAALHAIIMGGVHGLHIDKRVENSTSAGGGIQDKVQPHHKGTRMVSKLSLVKRYRIGVNSTVP